MLMNIWVRDTASGYIHQVGTDTHDSLEMFDGAVRQLDRIMAEGRTKT